MPNNATAFATPACECKPDVWAGTLLPSLTLFGHSARLQAQTEIVNPFSLIANWCCIRACVAREASPDDGVKKIAEPGRSA
jgi:hypothetical protein